MLTLTRPVLGRLEGVWDRLGGDSTGICMAGRPWALLDGSRLATVFWTFNGLQSSPRHFRPVPTPVGSLLFRKLKELDRASPQPTTLKSRHTHKRERAHPQKVSLSYPCTSKTVGEWGRSLLQSGFPRVFASPDLWGAVGTRGALADARSGLNETYHDDPEHSWAEGLRWCSRVDAVGARARSPWRGCSKPA
jgi:hypothetical protein